MSTPASATDRDAIPGSPSWWSHDPAAPAAPVTPQDWTHPGVAGVVGVWSWIPASFATAGDLPDGWAFFAPGESLVDLVARDPELPPGATETDIVAATMTRVGETPLLIAHSGSGYGRPGLGWWWVPAVLVFAAGPERMTLTQLERADPETRSSCEFGGHHAPAEPDGTDDGFSTCETRNNDVPVGGATTV